MQFESEYVGIWLTAVHKTGIWLSFLAHKELSISEIPQMNPEKAHLWSEM